MSNDTRFTSETGRRAAKASARVRRKLNVERVTQALGALDTPADAERWLRQVTIWSCAGQVPGTVAMAAVRAVDGWVKVRELSATFEVVEALRGDVRILREDRDRAIRDLELARLGIK